MTDPDNLTNSAPLPRPDVDPDGLLEYSVVFTDRSLNHMSKKFVGVMQELQQILRETYNAHTVAIVPGGGSYGMEAIARQFGGGKRCLVIRNGLFSFRWSAILDAGQFAASHDVIKAVQSDDSSDEAPAFAPAPIDQVVEQIREQRPEVVFAPHVETASGIILSDEYLDQLSAAVHEVGGLFVLDCVASGAMWVDMQARGVDVLLSAPQKGWSGTPCAGYVMLGEYAREVIESTQSSSFALDLRKWLDIAEGYVQGNHGYYATMPTDSLLHNLELMREAKDCGLATLRDRQIELGTKVRELFTRFGFVSVAAEGWQSPTVVVVNTPADASGIVGDFIKAGVQVAGGVPLQVGEPEGFASFRVGLFGLDKWADVDAAVARLENALTQVRGE